MKSNTSKEKKCSDESKQLYNEIVNSQSKRLAIKDIGMISLHLLNEIERLRTLWKSSEEAKDRVNQELQNTERLLAEARKKLDIFDIDVKETRGNMRLLLEENKALKLDLNVFEARERQLKDAMKSGAFDSLTKEDRDQFAFLREPLYRTYSKRLQQKHPQLVEEAQDEDVDSDVDYDVTGDSLDDVVTLRNGREIRRSSANGTGKRRSASAHAHVSAAPTMGINSKRSRSRVMAATIEEEPADGSTPPKRCRDIGNPEVTTTTTTTTTTTVSGQDSRSVRKSIHRQVTRRSLSCGSVPSIETPGHTTGFAAGLSSHAALTKSTLDMRTLKRNHVPVTWTNGDGREIARRQHTFEDVGINLKIPKCDECHAVIFSSSLKCKDCHQSVHKGCAARLHVPCIPRQKAMSTPKSANRNVKREYRLQDFCTNAKPMIPYPIVHCVVALEKRSMTQEGLYRVPGSTRVVTSLLNELRTSRTVPNLDLQDTEVITETLKRFLRDLRDPLVPRTSREEFIAAGNLFSSNRDQGMLALNRVICELPQANRDTMAYLFMHWRKVTSYSDLNKMPKENLSRVLAPCLMGVPSHRLDQTTASHDIANCERTLNAIFSFDDVYWQRFLGTVEQIETARHQQSQNVAVFDRSILGPVSKSPATPLLTRSAANRRLILGPVD